MDNVEVKSTKNKNKRDKKKEKAPRDKKKIACISVFVLGIMVLVAGTVFLVLTLLKGNSVADGEYLVDADSWVLTDCGEDNCDHVSWTFTELGKGKLTTDNHEHDYDFKWALEEDKLIIETDWLYELDNEFEYSLDQNSSTLILRTDDDKEYKFVAQ